MPQHMCHARARALTPTTSLRVRTERAGSKHALHTRCHARARCCLRALGRWAVAIQKPGASRAACRGCAHGRPSPACASHVRVSAGMPGAGGSSSSSMATAVATAARAARHCAQGCLGTWGWSMHTPVCAAQAATADARARAWSGARAPSTGTVGQGKRGGRVRGHRQGVALVVVALNILGGMGRSAGAVSRAVRVRGQRPQRATRQHVRARARARHGRGRDGGRAAARFQGSKS